MEACQQRAQLLLFPIAGERNCVTTFEITSKGETENKNWFHTSLYRVESSFRQAAFGRNMAKTCGNFSRDKITFLSMRRLRKDAHQPDRVNLVYMKLKEENQFQRKECT